MVAEIGCTVEKEEKERRGGFLFYTGICEKFLGEFFASAPSFAKKLDDLVWYASCLICFGIKCRRHASQDPRPAIYGLSRLA